MPDAAIVDWLKKGALYEPSTDAAVAAAFGADAIEAEIVTPLATAAGAVAEGVRSLAFMKGPLAEEVHDVPGQRIDLLGRPVTIVADRLGYDAGLTVFVIGADETSKPGRTILNVLRRLP